MQMQGHAASSRHGPSGSAFPARKLDIMSIERWRLRPYAHLLHHVVDGFYEPAFARFTNTRLSDGGSTGYQSLPVNVWETDDAYFATLMAPGLDEQTINVTVHDDTLSIEGVLALQAPEGATPVWQEFGPVGFRRSLRLGTSVDASKVEALYRNGLLMITMAKAEHSKPRQIQVLGTTSNEAKVT
jgi:HSP20 family molecular chaperone IbpA